MPVITNQSSLFSEPVSTLYDCWFCGKPGHRITLKGHFWFCYPCEVGWWVPGSATVEEPEKKDKDLPLYWLYWQEDIPEEEIMKLFYGLDEIEEV